MREVPVGCQGLVALVDDQDYEAVQQYGWTPLRSAHTIYARRLRRKDWPSPIYMHNFILGVRGIDHRDHDGLNNQRSNLREADDKLNSRNARKRRSATSSQYKGVSWDPSTCGRWRVHIQIDGYQRYLGSAQDEEEAAHIYDRAARRYFGEFACLNFPSAG